MFLILLFETGSLTGPVSHHWATLAVEQAARVLLSPPSTEVLDDCCQGWFYYVGARDSNLGPQACTASTVPTEPCPAPLSHVMEEKLHRM